ncbi:ABC transporter ATP-binding protein [Mameliella sediminis]|uniref:ABC transporter ATP-binding protein n=1 Tax=Mameliella sediminis TaxID=2836866 RepID=UPI001C43B908|nr:ATP-binding cassette domain-containing protein [Mameliella sediminis]MBY6114546.1 ATP-binding cassette domain-containing protein [Antarctobacter heliothermus]MBY6144119.1 ATP-binding cassette domain-containing protein [Mameliella alba]MBV7392973.1 ATP-binding cassette domain-containing protein [Mameliella sediminis]MBY6161589.1 ATP-binding cassette domain-containing protein [Mameliella alba]MBY6169945.1 ATP-binding cassette domain-containing protein [Mameliella alba]
MSYVEVKGLAKAYGKRTIIENVNVSVPKGQFISIVGASGCGKSTFLRLLLAQEQPTAGEIHIDGAPMAKEPGRDHGIVFQRYSVFPHMTVLDNLVAPIAFDANFWGRISRARRRQERDKARKTLARIGLDHVAGQYPSDLSGGMLQRLSIAQALASDPKILLLDEPFGALDPGTKIVMHDFLQELRDETGMTVFMITHDLEEAFKLGDRVWAFDKPVWDAEDPEANAATITYDFDARDNGIPYQTLRERTNVLQAR